MSTPGLTAGVWGHCDCRAGGVAVVSKPLAIVAERRKNRGGGSVGWDLIPRSADPGNDLRFRKANYTQFLSSEHK